MKKINFGLISLLGVLLLTLVALGFPIPLGALGLILVLYWKWFMAFFAILAILSLQYEKEFKTRRVMAIITLVLFALTFVLGYVTSSSIH